MAVLGITLDITDEHHLWGSCYMEGIRLPLDLTLAHELRGSFYMAGIGIAIDLENMSRRECLRLVTMVGTVSTGLGDFLREHSARIEDVRLL